MYLKYFQLMVDSSLLLQDALVFDGLTDAYGKYHMVRKSHIAYVKMNNFWLSMSSTVLLSLFDFS